MDTSNCRVIRGGISYPADDQPDVLSETVAELVGLVANRPEQERLLALLFVWNGKEHKPIHIFANAFREVFREFTEEPHSKFKTNLKSEFLREIRNELLKNLSPERKARIESTIEQCKKKLGQDGYTSNNFRQDVQRAIRATTNETKHPRHLPTPVPQPNPSSTTITTQPDILPTLDQIKTYAMQAVPEDEYFTNLQIFQALDHIIEQRPMPSYPLNKRDFRQRMHTFWVYRYIKIRHAVHSDSSVFDREVIDLLVGRLSTHLRQEYLKCKGTTTEKDSVKRWLDIKRKDVGTQSLSIPKIKSKTPSALPISDEQIETYVQQIITTASARRWDEVSLLKWLAQFWMEWATVEIEGGEESGNLLKKAVLENFAAMDKRLKEESGLSHEIFLRDGPKEIPTYEDMFEHLNTQVAIVRARIATTDNPISLRKFDNGLLNFIISLLPEESQKGYEEHLKLSKYLADPANFIRRWLDDRINSLQANT